MATSKNQCSTTIDKRHHEWYRKVASQNQFVTIAGMMRQAHGIYQQNYVLLSRLQRRLQDGGVHMSNAEMVGKLLRMAIYRKVDFTIVRRVNNSCAASLRQRKE